MYNDIEKKETLLKKARRSVWLYRIFGCDIPADVEFLIVEQKCCTESFMQKFVLKHHLVKNAELLFADIYLKSNPALVSQYVSNYTVSPEFQVKIIKSKNVDVLFTLFDFHRNSPSYFSFSSPAQCALVLLNDPDFMVKVLKKWNISLFYEPLAILLESENPELLSAYKSLFPDGKGFVYGHEKILLKCKNPKMFEIFISMCCLSPDSITSLIEENKTDKLTLYISMGHILPPDCISKLIDKGDFKLLAAYITQHPLTPDNQIKLIDKGYKDMLKLHYKRHGFANETLTYFAGLQAFKAFVDLHE